MKQTVISAYPDNADVNVPLYELGNCDFMSTNNESEPTSAIFKCMLDCGRIYKSYHTSKINRLLFALIILTLTNLFFSLLFSVTRQVN